MSTSFKKPFVLSLPQIRKEGLQSPAAIGYNNLVNIVLKGFVDICTQI